jgi:hypothetical protein
MKTSATQSGVPNDQTDGDNDDEVIQREPSARELAMEAIASGHEERATAEMSPQPDNKQALDNQLDAQLETTPAPQSGKVKVKVDGIEDEVTQEDLIRSYQVNRAADRRMAEATELLKQAKTAASATPPVGVEPKTPTNDSPANPKEGEEQRKRLLEAMFDGDQEAALQAMEELGIGRPQAPIQQVQDPAQVVSAVKQQLVVDGALAKFSEDYADIVQDPYLADLADKFLDAEVANGVPLTDALGIAGQKTRDWLKSMGVSKPEPAPTTGRNTKLERKEGIDVIPSLRTKATVQEDAEESASDVIAQMRKQRGLEV